MSLRWIDVLGKCGGGEMAERHEPAKIAIALHVYGQQHQLHAREVLRFVERSGPSATLGVNEWPLWARGKRVVSGEFRQARNVQCYADNRFYFRFLRQLVKLYRRIQAVRIRQRHGRHFLLDRSGDDLFRRRHAAQKRVVAMTM